jgi:hypothetical protein
MGFWVQMVWMGPSFICSFVRRRSLHQLLFTPGTSQLQPVMNRQWYFNNEIPNEVLRVVPESNEYLECPSGQGVTHSQLWGYDSSAVLGKYLSQSSNVVI